MGSGVDPGVSGVEFGMGPGAVEGARYGVIGEGGLGELEGVGPGLAFGAGLREYLGAGQGHGSALYQPGT